MKLSLLTGPGLHWHLFTPNCFFCCCNEIVIRRCLTPYVFTCYVSLVSTSKFDCSFPLNLTASHTGFVVVWIVPITVDLFIRPNSVSLLFFCYCCSLLSGLYRLLITHLFSTCCIYISCFFPHFLFFCHYLLPLSRLYRNLTYIFLPTELLWIGNAFALYTCVQCDHSVFLTSFGSCLAGRITICERCTSSLFTPVLSCRSSTVWL